MYAISSKGSRFRPGRTPGFTLVELLVVMSVISLLIALLLPTLASARQSAMQAKCLANQRQLGLGAIQYTNDSRGYYPLSYWARYSSYNYMSNFIYRVRADTYRQILGDFGKCDRTSMGTPIAAWRCPDANDLETFKFMDLFSDANMTMPAQNFTSYLQTSYLQGGYLYLASLPSRPTVDGVGVSVPATDTAWRDSKRLPVRVGEDNEANRTLFADKVGGQFLSPGVVSSTIWAQPHGMRVRSYTTGAYSLPIMEGNGVNEIFADGHGQLVRSYTCNNSWTTDGNPSVMQVDLTRLTPGRNNTPATSPLGNNAYSGSIGMAANGSAMISSAQYWY